MSTISGAPLQLRMPTPKGEAKKPKTPRETTTFTRVAESPCCKMFAAFGLVTASLTGVYAAPKPTAVTAPDIRSPQVFDKPLIIKYGSLHAVVDRINPDGTWTGALQNGYDKDSVSVGTYAGGYLGIGRVDVLEREGGLKSGYSAMNGRFARYDRYVSHSLRATGKLDTEHQALLDKLSTHFPGGSDYVVDVSTTEIHASLRVRKGKRGDL